MSKELPPVWVGQGDLTAQLSVGLPSTLGSYLELATVFFGPDSPQVQFIVAKIEESPNGTDEVVLADERQMILLLASI